MTPTILRRVTAGALLLVTAGCGLLDVSDPTAIEEEDVATAIGADLLRRDALGRLYLAVGEAVLVTGILSDELFGRDHVLDQRQSTATGGGTAYTRWKEVRRAATLALPQILAHGAESTRRVSLGEMFAVRGYATLGLAEGFCPGFPLHDIVDFQPVYGPPLATDAALEHALADFDSALVYASDSAAILDFARVGRARALLGLGRFPEAAEAAGAVPTPYTRTAEYSSAQVNFLGLLWQIDQLISVGNRDGGNGLDFVDAGDPRLPVRFMRTTSSASWYAATKYPNDATPIVVASGLEARLIEAEAALRATPDQPQWLTILNTLRTDGTFDTQPNPDDPAQTDTFWHAGTGGVAGLAPLQDPGSGPARVDLLFRERAFWLYGTAHRLGDLRRLIARYDRSSESVFPTGPYYRGGLYGPATSLWFPVESETPYNPAVTGCTDQ